MWNSQEFHKSFFILAFRGIKRWSRQLKPGRIVAEAPLLVFNACRGLVQPRLPLICTAVVSDRTNAGPSISLRSPAPA